MTIFSSQSAISKVDELLLDEVIEDDPRVKSQILAKARSTVKEALSRDPQNPELHYALGLCYYHEPEWSDEMSATIESSFKKALDLEPRYVSASLYLGHYYFDKGRYEQALEQFSKMDHEFFERFDQDWRALKNKELILCCRLYLTPTEVPLSDVDALCREYEGAEQHGVLWPSPAELVLCLTTLMKISPVEVRPLGQRVLDMLAELEFEDAPAIADEYRTLKRLVSDQ